MKQVLLGQTGVTVSELCLGCMNFGTKTEQVVSERLLDQYVDAGGSFLDTANNYAFWNEGGEGGESERLLGHWMKERGNRSNLFLATKVGALPTVPGGGLSDGEGLSKQSIERAIDQSLQRLRTDYIDLYYAHIDDIKTPLEETLEAFEKLVRLGKVRFIGCSNYTVERLAEARLISQEQKGAHYCCIQQRHTYLHPNKVANFGVQKYATQELLVYCKKENISVLAYSPLLGGYYNRSGELPSAYSGDESEANLKELIEIARELGVTPNQVVLAWLRESSFPSIPIIAASTSNQLDENLNALQVELTRDNLNRLSTLGQVR